ncbi:MAG: hypothetical protein DSZ03_06425 [Sulfurimonas sp.]|nr:MAG: hypothetical protein DSZ03_06425 [Sulfurimonas sp.]
MTFEEILHQYKEVYYRFPQSLKTFLGSVYGSIPLSIRFGKHYSIHETLLREFEAADTQFQLDFIYNKTLETLLFAEQHIPYYQKRFREYGLSAKDFKSPEDIAQFPTLHKEDIKTHIANLHSNVAETPVAYYSGGSLSTPTQYFLPASSRAKEKAYNNYIFSQIGYRYRDRALLSRGREIFKPHRNTYWEYEPVDNYLYLCSSYMNSDIFPKIYTKALKFKPKFFIGYPSAVLSFMKQSKKHHLTAIPLEGIILASETLYQEELRTLQEYFDTKVLTHYGHTERSAIAYRINDESYRFLASYGLVRIVNEEIITTSFDNFVMPFINYQTADHATGTVTYYPQSSVVKGVTHIEGRIQDFLVTKDHRLISITAMTSATTTSKKGHFVADDIHAVQYIQSEPGKVTVLLEGTPSNPNAIAEKMTTLLQGGIDFDLNIVERIDKTPRGKRVICKQSLDIERFRHTTASLT